MSGIDENDSFSLSFNENATNPFDFSLPANVKYVLINVVFTSSDQQTLFKFLDELASYELYFYVSDIRAVYLDTGINATLSIYTFYYPTN